MNITKNPIAIFEEGNSQNQSIIFVHGFPYDHLMWKKVVEKLSGSFHCVTYDIRGMGISDPGDGQYTIESMADDLLFVINKLNLDKPYLCGMSMGGYIALRAVEREEKLFRGLLLLDTKASSDPDEVKLKRAMGIKKINEEGVQKYSAEFVPGTFTKESIEWLGEDYIAVLGRSMNLDPVGVKGCLLAMAARTDTTAYLDKISIPTLVLCGEKDKLTPPEVMKEMSDKIKGSQFFIVPSSAHMTPLENPEFVSDKINSFCTLINK